jgi:hypothetical protein
MMQQEKHKGLKTMSGMKLCWLKDDDVAGWGKSFVDSSTDRIIVKGLRLDSRQPGMTRPLLFWDVSSRSLWREAWNPFARVNKGY